MAVDTEHPEYRDTAPVWRQMRDTAAGQRAIHAAAETYLPKLAKETPEDYAARLQRSSYFNATARTIEGLSSMVMRVPPVVEASAGVVPMLEDVTKGGVSMATFCGKVLDEALTVGRVGVLVDYPRVQRDPDNPLTVAQAEALNLRPNMALYKTEAIINWNTEWRNNASVLVMVVLAEHVRVPGKDEFEIKTEPRWRVLDLDPETGAYRVRIYRKATSGGGDELIEEFFPLLNGAPLSFIPFQFIGVEDTTPDVSKPPLLDLSDTNLSHYRSTSDRKHGAHLTALPQPWVNKVQPSIDPMTGQPCAAEWKIGGTELWTFPQDSQVGMLEYTGQGLATLREEIEREEKQMAVLGARMLEQQQRQVETAEAAGIHRSGEQSTLQAQTSVAGDGMTKALQWFDAWGGGSGAATVTYNKDYMPSALSSQELTALVAAWQQGALPKQDLFLNLQQGGLIPESKTFEEYEGQLETAGPVLAATPTPAPGA